MLENELILHRHVNAILLSQFLRYRKRQGIDIERLSFCGDFFDNNLSEEPHSVFLQEWIDSERNEIKNQLQKYARLLPKDLKLLVDNGIDHFLTDLRRLNDEHYQPITRYYREQIQQFADQLGNTALNSQTSQEVESQQRYYRNLLDRMRGSKGRKSGYLIDYLSSNGVLPSYSFPLHTVELLLPKEARLSEHLRLEARLAPGNK